MLRILRLLIAIIVILLSSYSLLANDNSFLTLSQILLGILLFIIGIEQAKKKNRGTAFVCTGVGVFVWGVLITQYFF